MGQEPVTGIRLHWLTPQTSPGKKHSLFGKFLPEGMKTQPSYPFSFDCATMSGYLLFFVHNFPRIHFQGKRMETC